MQRTLEDEDNYENTSLDIDLNIYRRKIEVGRNIHLGDKDSKSSAALARVLDEDRAVNTTDEASVTEKHHEEDCQNTQDADFTVVDSHVNRGFVSDIIGAGTQPVLEDENMETERVLGTESPAQKLCLHKGCDLAGDVTQLDDGYMVQDIVRFGQTQCADSFHGIQSDRPSSQKNPEDTEIETAGTIRTADLVTSEVAGSWACSTAPSVHGENEFPRSKGEDDNSTALPNSNCFVAESQNIPSNSAAKLGERRALAEMIGIVAPDLRDKFSAGVGRKNLESDCDSDDTEDYSGSEHAKGCDDQGSYSDRETQGCNQDERNESLGSASDDDDEETQDGGAV